MDREGNVHLLQSAYRLRNHLRTFWFKCNSLISLVTYNDPEIVHFTFSITLLSLRFVRFRLSDFPVLSHKLSTRTLLFTQIVVGLPQMDRVADDQQFTM